MSNTPNPSSAIFWFFIITSIYFTVKYNTKNNEKSAQNMYFGIYILLIVIGEYFIFSSIHI